MTRFVCTQSWWAMVGLPRGAEPWSPEACCEKIALAGFQGVHGGVRDAESAQWFRDHLPQHGLQYIGNAVVAADADLRQALEYQVAAGAELVNLQLCPALNSPSQNSARVELAMRIAEKLGIEVTFETHRGRVTQDPLRAQALMAAVPDALFTVDLSHWMVGGEGVIDATISAIIDEVLARAACIHGRVSNGHQVQIDIGPEGDHPAVAPYMQWWRAAMRGAIAAGRDQIVFVSELGPPPYAIVDLQGHEMSDRWQQALVLATLARQCWDAVSADK